MLNAIWTSSSYVLGILAVPLAVIVVSCIYVELRRPRNLPPYPGARPLPFLGHKLKVPTSRSWLWFKKMNDEYGDIITVYDSNVPRIVIGHPQVAIDLLERRSHKYSSRPRFVAAGELLLGGKGMVHAPYGDAWRAQRKVFHMAMMPKATDSYLHIMEMEGKQLALHLVRDGAKDWYEEIYRYTASLIVCISYGRRITDTRTDKAYQKLNQSLSFFIRVKVPGAQWFEIFPFLAKLPSFLVPLKRDALKYREMGRENARELVEEVKRKVKAGNAPESFCRELLEIRNELGWEELGLDDIDFNGMPASLFGAGIDTTSSILQSLVLVMVSFPEVQKKVHEEMDRVVGDGRSPNYNDKDDLVYTEAVIKETMRWRPVAVLGGTPHASTEDDWYEHKGKTYFIPAGSIVQGNMWSIHQNKEVYPDPEKFDPERFLHGQEYPSTNNRGHSSFGWGRRVCPGQHFAERSLFLTGSRLLWGFNYSPYINPETKEPEYPDTSMETGYKPTFNTRPYQFKCVIEPRTEKIKQTILQEAAEAKEGLKVYEENRE
ncbi:cytochrome P450 [Atractiella rhizophila]|nr:cytochrome P450 [Atractiella rhizophila]